MGFKETGDGDGIDLEKVHNEDTNVKNENEMNEQRDFKNNNDQLLAWHQEEEKIRNQEVGDAELYLADAFENLPDPTTRYERMG